MSVQPYFTRFAFIALVGAAFAGCRKSAGDPVIPIVPTAPKPNVVVATDATFGKIITDSSGKTLYFFTPDANGKSACSGGCAAAWPPFYAASLRPGEGLDSSDFGKIARSDGSSQSTYKGWPLYYFEFDSKAGDIKGDGAETVWFVSKPDYTVMLANVQLVGNDGVAYDSTYKPGSGVVQVLTDDRGATLYAFSADKANKNNYTKSDFSNDAFWPIFQPGATLVAPSVIDAADLGTITVFGKTQLTFKQWPMYHFGPDEGARASTKGVSVPTPGVWPVVNQFSAAAPQ